MFTLLVAFFCVFWCGASHNSWEEAKRNMGCQHQKRRRGLAMAGLHESVVGLTESFQSLSLRCLDPKTADADVGRDTGGLTFHGAYQCGLRVSLDHTSWRLVRLVTGTRISIVDIGQRWGDMDQGSRVANNGAEAAKSASQNTRAGMSFM